MKFLYSFLIIIFLQNCSFDDKTGIWKNEGNIEENENIVFKDFKEISTTEGIFKKTINLNKSFKFQLSEPINNIQWNDLFFYANNNTENFAYNNTNQVIFKSKRLSKYNLNKFLLFEKNNLITSDLRGNIIIFSINDNIISKFNFYKKKYKKIKKNLNLIIEKNIIYASDNIGYLYAYNYNEKKVLWAKNYKTPFRSNLKILGNKLVASNEKNELFFFNKKNGDIFKKIPSEETPINNNFINNLSLNYPKIVYFLNSYGSLYSINIDQLNINWFLNLRSSIDLSPNNLFLGNEIVNSQNKIIVSSTNKTYIINAKNGLIENKFNFSSLIRPIINKNYAFFISKNNFFIAIDLKNNEILYSYNINDKLIDFLDVKKKNLDIHSFKLINNNIHIFLKNSLVLNFDIRGGLKEILKLPIKIHTQPIIIDNSILYVNRKNKLIILN